MSNLIRVYLLITRLPWNILFVNKTLNRHVGPTRSHEEFLFDKPFNLAFGNDEDDLNEALLQASDEFESKNHALCNNTIFGSGSISSSIYNKHRPKQTYFLLLYNWLRQPLIQAPPTVGYFHRATSTVALQKLEPHYIPIKLQYFV